MTDDRRLIEDYIPLKAISEEAAREKGDPKGKIAAIHLWWARRPITAARAAVYGALAPVPEGKNGRGGRSRFVAELCRYPGDRAKFAAAEDHILTAHALRLASASPNIDRGMLTRPRVLDPFAGGGAIPLEATRLGCDAYALELNPIAHLIQLVTLDYARRYGPALAEDLRRWGEVILQRAAAEIGDLYPPVGDSSCSTEGGTGRRPVQQGELFITRRNLPHWEMGGSTYFITYRCATGVTLVEAVRSTVLENWRHWEGKRYLLHALVVMPDHVHALITPLPDGTGSCYALEQILHTNKSYTAHQINASSGHAGAVWQDERFDRIIRDEAEFLEKWNYIASNAVKAGLVEQQEQYPWLYQDAGTGAGQEENTGQRPVPPPLPSAVPPVDSKSLSTSGTGGPPVLPGDLFPVAYLWTRTVRCKRPDCGGDVPLVRQTWLCRKKGRMVAVRGEVDATAKTVRYRVVEAKTESGLAFDPEEGSTGGNATCPFCRTVADAAHIKSEGRAGRLGRALLAVSCTRSGAQGKVFLSPEQAGAAGAVDDAEITGRIEALTRETAITPPDEPLPEQGTLGFRVQAYGLTRWRDLFTPRQLLSLLVFTKHIRKAHLEILAESRDPERSRAVAAALTCVLDRLADFNSSLCRFAYIDGERVVNTFSRGALPMTWDFAETNPFNPNSASWPAGIKTVGAALANVGQGRAATVVRGSATELPFEADFFDAVVTDPPYYDNVPYADLSDFFYVWAKRAIGDLFPEHFATPLTPKRREATAEPARHGGDKKAARRKYEVMMAQAFAEMNRVLKPGAPLVCVYAHKTVAGWATLIDALRSAGFVVVEAWPLDTEKPGRLRDQNSAALASSIFLVARRREGRATGSYEREVRPELEAIVRERTETLWKEGVTGADLVIAAVGAGLRAFTRFEKVEFGNGQEVPADRFIREVEGAVLETVLRKVGVRDADPATKFYLAWRLQYRTAELDAGEAIVFAYPLGVELDGADGLTAGARALVTKKGKKIRLRDYSERGEQEGLGLPSGTGRGTGGPPVPPSLSGLPSARDSGGGSGGTGRWPVQVPLIDVLHRALWLMEHRPAQLREFLDKARPDGERLRLVAQALAGTALQGTGEELTSSSSPEQSAIRKLIANWRSVFEESLFSNQSTSR